MMWNTDISKAPRGTYEIQSRRLKNGSEAIHEVFRPEYIWLASKCGIVTRSCWLPQERSPAGHLMKGGRRWEFFAKGEKPVAWRPIEAGDIYQVTDEKTERLSTRYRIPAHPNPELVRAA